MNVRNHRLREIAEVLLRHGWGFLLDVAGPEHLTVALSGSQPRHDSPRPPKQLRLAIELDGGMHSVFATFDPDALAAASIGQAHAATLHDGTAVVVKIRRPGAAEKVREDLEILLNVAARASRHWELAARYDIVGLPEEFAQMLRAQLDYLREGRNAESGTRGG
jgi:predicted unusual protein kinase regulating ubiquinone biosynthesis (AarF/ABC1/UbiB family)